VSRSIITLEILQPGDRAAELLHAVHVALDVQVAEGRDDQFVRLTSDVAYPVALTKAERALWSAGDPNGEIVRVMTGQ
jgi:hypothetical protein